MCLFGRNEDGDENHGAKGEEADDRESVEGLIFSKCSAGLFLVEFFKECRD